MQPLLKVEHVKVVYNAAKDNEFVALDDISLEIFPEEYIIFFGPSGCGKSTLLYTILGLQTPTRGKLYVGGKDSGKFTEKEKGEELGKTFGIVFQNFNLIYSLNVLDNIVLPQIFTEVGRKERRERAMTLLKRFGIESRANSLPGNLSGGQQQRVAICRALINDPRIILADEPVGNLDSASADTVMETLADINKKDKKTVILVTHDPRYLPYADRVCYFSNGRLERIVRNKAGKEEVEMSRQVGPITMDDLRRLARTSDLSSVAQMKAWAVVNYLTQDCVTPQLERMEKTVEQFLSGKITEQHLLTSLDQPYAQGGVGLHKGTAAKLAREIESTRHLVDRFKTHFEHISEEPHRNALVDDVKTMLLEEYSHELSGDQKHRLSEIITLLVVGKIRIQDFYTLLDKSEDDGGIGLNTMTALHLSEKLKVLLAQIYESK